jgi:hypothetical protein
MSAHRTIRRRGNAIGRIKDWFCEDDHDALDVVLAYYSIDTLEVIAVRIDPANRGDLHE